MASPPPAETEENGGPRPRRRREQSEASAFLSKTYAMIDALPPEVGGWSETGDSMVIYDAETFAAQIIPQYFKHNNFRSFVRQLNFYGFRKLRADASAANANRWEFKHGNFRRGRPELLVQIRRAEHYDYTAPDAAAQKQRQSEMERELQDLRQRVSELSQTVDDLRATVRTLLAATDEKPLPPQKKKRRTDEVLGPAPTFSPGSLDVLAGVDAPAMYAQSLEGKPLKRLRTNNFEGQPLSRRLSTFETSRLDSLIRTLNDDGPDDVPVQDIFGPVTGDLAPDLLPPNGGGDGGGGGGGGGDGGGGGGDGGDGGGVVVSSEEDILEQQQQQEKGGGGVPMS